MNKDLIIQDTTIKKYDETIAVCSSAMMNAKSSLEHSSIVLKGAVVLEKVLHSDELKPLVQAATNSYVGFLTDRDPNKYSKKPKPPYTYDQIVAALIPCLLQGYRITGNEINIISGKGMPVKAGKYRKIIEMTDSFSENIGTVAIKDNFAFIKCSAKWIINGTTQTLGAEEGDECHIKIPYGAYDSVDKAQGLAQSKLYSRVLTRITGQFVAEGEPDNASTIKDITPDGSPDYPSDRSKSDPFAKKVNPVNKVTEDVEPEVEPEPEVISYCDELRGNIGAPEYIEAVNKFCESKSLTKQNFNDMVGAIVEQEDHQAAAKYIKMLDGFKNA